MKRIVALCVAALVSFSVLTAPRPAKAQMQYLKAFTAKYETVKKEAMEKKCLICHGKESKKQRSDYAKALEKALGAKKVKDVEKINEALATVEKEKVKEGESTTYGDLLKEGELPEPYKAEK